MPTTTRITRSSRSPTTWSGKRVGILVAQTAGRPTNVPADQRSALPGDAPIPEARRKAVPGVRLCVRCQEEEDAAQHEAGGYNRRGSKDSQLR